MIHDLAWDRVALVAEYRNESYQTRTKTKKLWLSCWSFSKFFHIYLSPAEKNKRQRWLSNFMYNIHWRDDLDWYADTDEEKIGRSEADQEHVGDAL